MDDFSMWALFARASFTVQVVMLMLIGASVWGWTIIVQKLVAYRKARAEAARFDDSFWSGEPLDELYDDVARDPSSAPERVFVAGMTEWRRSIRDDGRMIPGAAQRIDRSMDVAIAREAEAHEKGLGFLATVGATAPFIGLFGTVWGIMRAFIEIAEAQNTNLAVVAPGIAEALLATGLGLLAAIPAVIFYNKLSADAARLTQNYETFADEFSTLLGRQTDAQAA